MSPIKIPVCEPLLGQREVEYVTECVKSGWISSKGEYVRRFEKLFSNYCGVRHGVATSNGTAAVHLALRALDLGKGDEVIVPSFSMIAVPNAVTYTGAKIVLVDSDPYTWNMDVSQIEDIITPRTKAIIAVHTYGHPVDMAPLQEVAQKHGVHVVEDAAEAHGAEYKGARCGSLGDVACFSFYANKIITTGEGGMVVTNNTELAEKVALLRDHAFESRRFIHRFIGYNYRLTNVQAAIGVAQMERIQEFVNMRRQNASYYKKLLRDIKGLTMPPEANWARSVFWMFSMLVKRGYGISRDALISRLASKFGVETRPFFHPVHLQPVYRRQGGSHRYPVAERIAKAGMNLPSGNNLTRSNIEYVCDSIGRLSAN